MSNTVPVLLYHHVNSHEGDAVTVTPEVFKEQMRFLAESGFRTIHLAELLDLIKGTASYFDNAVVISFDDGWLDNYLFAYPVLLKYRFKATSFLVSNRVDAAKVIPLPVNVPCHEDAKRLIRNGEAGTVVMSWDLIRKIQREGFMEFYSHTATHRKCAGLDGADLTADLQISKSVLEKELGRSCPYLCWPYGDYNDAAVQTAISVGYEALFTTDDGFSDTGSDPYRIKRIEVKNSVEWLQMRLLKGDL